MTTRSVVVGPLALAALLGAGCGRAPTPEEIVRIQSAVNSTVVVTVVDTVGTPKPNQVVGWEDTAGNEGGWLPTNASGVVQLSPPSGAYFFKTEIGGTEFVSGPSGHCVTPGCTAATVLFSRPVDVLVADTGGAPLSGKTVMWQRASDEYLGGNATTNASGHASVYPPMEPARFQVTVDGTTFYSGSAGHCTQPSCATTATILVSQQTVVTVVDGNSQPISGRAVTPLSDEGITSGNKTTNTSGQATFRLPFAHWRFRATCSGTTEQFFSGNAGHCFIPGGCLTAKITMPCGQCAGKANGTACNDQNPCTGSSACQNQKCTGGSPMSCPASDQCHDAGACGAQTGTCSNSAKANGASCSDGNGCTRSDTCQGGVCTGANPVVCAGGDQCHDAGVCNGATGLCSSPAKANGTACDDGDPCTTNDVCSAGICRGPTSFTCAAFDTCHAAGTCTSGSPPAGPPSTQDLLGWWKLDGDGTDATGGGHDLTNEGAVPAPGRSGMAMRFDGTSCMTVPIWDEARMQGGGGLTIMAWINPDVYECTQQYDMNAVVGRGWDYSIGAWCYEGVPPGYGQGVAAAVRNVNPPGWGYGGGWGSGTGWHHVAFTWDHQRGTTFLDAKVIGNWPFPGDITDWDPLFTVGCMTSWYWSGFDRINNFHGAVDEVMLYDRPLSATEIESYYKASDPCPHAVYADGSACSDGNACTQGDTCQSGTCGGSPVTCVAQDQCHVAGTCNIYMGCSNPPAPDGTECNDGDTCTQSETCQAAVCRPPAVAYPVIVNLPVEDLGHLPGGSAPVAYDINASGEIVGTEMIGSEERGWRRPAGGPMVDITALTGLATPTWPLAINNAGTAVGLSGSLEAMHAFRYSASGVLDDFGTIGESAGDADVNAAGQVAGWFTLGGKGHGYRYTDGIGFEDVGSLNGETTAIDAINDAGTVFGSSAVGGRLHLVRFDNAVIGLEDLSAGFDPTLGWDQTWAVDAAGDYVVGNAYRAGGYQPIRLHDGVAEAIPSSFGWWTFGMGVNAAGDVVGYGYHDAQLRRADAFVYTDQLGFKKLNDLIDPASGWDLQFAVAINDSREIVGRGVHNGQSAAFRLSLSPQQIACGSPNQCGGGNSGDICLWTEGVVDTGDGHFVAVFGYQSSHPGSFHPAVNEVRVNGTLVTNPQPVPPGWLPTGAHPGGYTPRFDAGQTISWTIDGKTATASAASTRRLPRVSIGSAGYGVMIGGQLHTIKADLPNEPVAQPEPAPGDLFDGTLTGQLSVSPSGAATYSVPIKMPPGIAGMAPNVSLVYNSQGGDGIAGQGWELGGLSMIHRCPRTKAQDGVGHQVTMVDNDPDEAVCLDGKRLFEQETAFTYRLEQEDNSTITKISDDVHIPPRSLNAVWFKVVTKTGEIRYYGRNRRTRVVLPGQGLDPAGPIAAWALERVMDPWGNYYDIHYNSDAGNFGNDGLQVTKIDYTGHAHAIPSPTNAGIFEHVNFDYEARSDVRYVRFGDLTLPRRFRLKSISTSAGMYSLTYAKEYDPSLPFGPNNDPMLPSRLTEIKYCVGGRCMQPLSFEWEGGGYRWDPAPSYAPPKAMERFGSNREKTHGTQLVDIDGDGRPELVEYRGFGGRSTWKNTGQGWASKPEWMLPTLLADENDHRAMSLFADVDGDGLPDMVGRAYSCVTTSGFSTCTPFEPLSVWLNRTHKANCAQTGKCWEPHNEFLTSGTLHGDSTINFNNKDTLADMNGDGMADIVRFGPGDYEIQVLYSTGHGWAAPVNESYSAVPLRSADPTVTLSHLKLEDLNRDGLPDLVTTYGSSGGCQGERTIAINTGANTTNGTVWRVDVHGAPCPTDVPPDKRVVGDLDGDGFRDTLTFYKTVPTNISVTGQCSAGTCSCGSGEGCAVIFECETDVSCGCTCARSTTTSEVPLASLATGSSWTFNGTGYLSTSLTHFKPRPSQQTFTVAERKDFIYNMADLNGDGLADFVLNHQDGGQLLVNTGQGFIDIEGATSWQASAGPAAERRIPIVPTDDEDFPSEGATFVDLDGDGVSDLVRAKIDSTGQLSAAAWLNRFKPPVIKRFPNGLAEKSEVSYAVISTSAAQAAGIYRDVQEEAGSITTYFMAPVRVVSSISAEDGSATGTMFSTDYFYEELRGSRFGRGPQGFSRITTVDNRAATDDDPLLHRITETNYYQYFPYTGLPGIVRQKIGHTSAMPPPFPAAVVLSTTLTGYCDTVLENAPGNPECHSGISYNPGTSLFVYPIRVIDVTTLFEGPVTANQSIGTTTIDTEYRHDLDGNPVSTTVRATMQYAPPGQTAVVQVHEKKVVNSYESPQGGSIPTYELSRFGKVTHQVVTAQSKTPVGPTVTHTTDFVYEYGQAVFPEEENVAVRPIALRRKIVEPGSTPSDPTQPDPHLELHTVFDYDQFGHVATTTECAADFSNCGNGSAGPAALPYRITRVSYDPTVFAPAGGRVTSLAYTNGRFPVRTTNAAGHVEYTAYHPLHGGLVQKTGPNGIHTCYTYDQFGRETTEVERCGSVTELITSITPYLTKPLDPAGAKVMTVTHPPTGAATWVYADAFGRAINTRGRSFDGGFTETFQAYDRWGRLERESPPRTLGSNEPVNVTISVYDEVGRVTKVIKSLGPTDSTGQPRTSIMTMSYHGPTIWTEHNLDGEDEAHLHAQHREETKGVLGKVVSVKVLPNPGEDPTAITSEITYTYDGEGNLTDAFDGPNVVHLTYDLRGRKLSTFDPDLGNWTYEYNGFGDLVSQTDAKSLALGTGPTITMTYDVLGRMASKTDATGTAHWIYDRATGAGKGKLAAIVSAPDERLAAPCTPPYDVPQVGNQAVRSFSYTAFGELQDETACTGGESFSTTYGYDDTVGRQNRITYPFVNETRLSLRYEYTSLGFLHYVADAADGSPYWVGTERNASGQVTREYLRNGVETTSTRSPATGWLIASQSIAHADADTLIQSWSYGFDELGNLRRRVRDDAINGAPSEETFTYDSLSRLKTSEVTLPDYHNVETYDYDVRGNLTRKGNKGYTYTGCAAGPHAVCGVDGVAFSYDRNGNMESGGGRTLRYDAANKPVHIENGASSVDFIYGADGHRIVQIAHPPGGDPATTVYVGLGATGKSVYERTVRGGTVEHTHFLYAGGVHGGAAFALKVVRQEPSTDPKATTSYYHFDHLGSVTAISDESGHVVSADRGGTNATAMGYDAWGARRDPSGRAADPASFARQAGHREFTGHEAIPDVGLVNMNGRVYDPVIGRFLSPDPNVQFVANLQSYNRYSYVLNNPLSYTDPTGYFAWGVGNKYVSAALSLGTAAACIASGGGACVVATMILTEYRAMSMLASGASFAQVVEVTAVGIGAGMIGNAAGGSISSAFPGDPLALIASGATSSIVSSALSSVALGGSLSAESLIQAAFTGALNAAATAAFRGTNPVSQASAAAAGGRGASGAARVERAAEMSSEQVAWEIDAEIRRGLDAYDASAPMSVPFVLNDDPLSISAEDIPGCRQSPCALPDVPPDWTPNLSRPTTIASPGRLTLVAGLGMQAAGQLVYWGGSASAMLVFDTNGGVGIALTAGARGGIGLGATIGPVMSLQLSPDGIMGLEGPSISLGADWGAGSFAAGASFGDSGINGGGFNANVPFAQKLRLPSLGANFFAGTEVSYTKVFGVP